MWYAPPPAPPAKRPLPHRAAALLAVLLVLFSWTGDALGLHPCPHHSAVATAEGGHGGGHSHAAARDAAPSPEEEGHAECTCVGSCPAGVALSVPAASSAVAAAPLARAEVSLRAAGTELPDRFLPHVLPYGQAPPARLVRY